MGYRGIIRSLIWFCSYSVLVISFDFGEDYNCDYEFCNPAPLEHYRALNCIPYYYGNYKCCPSYFDCDHLYQRQFIQKHHYVIDRVPYPVNRCYLNGYEYKFGERPREEDLNICEEDCICGLNEENLFPDFNCKTRTCPKYKPTRDNCFQRKELEKCCPTGEICPKYVGEPRPLCSINTRIYQDEQYFKLRPKFNRSVPDSVCVCRAYEKGNFTIPCTWANSWFDMHAANRFYNDCVPVYLPSENGHTEFRTHSWRCQNDNDYILPHWTETYIDSKKFEDDHGPLPEVYCNSAPTANTKLLPDSCHYINPGGYNKNITHNTYYRYMCKYGQKTMHRGDQLNGIRYGANSCIVCTCWVPPIPTCILKENVTICV